MKTNTLVNAETQANLKKPVRIEQLKLGVDWHADHFRVVRMCDGQSPQPAQRFTPASFLPFVQKQISLADQVFVVYEAGPGGFHLHRQLTALGATAFVVHRQKLVFSVGVSPRIVTFFGHVAFPLSSRASLRLIWFIFRPGPRSTRLIAWVTRV
ncbi:MAG TPA: hypothetical protein VG077_03725 [Verrucomicrobiae bacterium]|nr:hypothetical protein [Verrucomicrobiae bacterium]